MGAYCTNGPAEFARNKIELGDVLKTPTRGKPGPMLPAIAGHIQERPVAGPSVIHIEKIYCRCISSDRRRALLTNPCTGYLDYPSAPLRRL